MKALAARLRATQLKSVGLFDRAGRRRVREACAVQAADELHRRHLGDLIRTQYTQAQQDQRWQALNDHDPEQVIAEVDAAFAAFAAFADNASNSTCIDAGTDLDSGQTYLSCLVIFGTPDMVPEQIPATTPGGRPTLKKRTKTDRNRVYLAALASTVLATAKEALASSPATTNVDILVLSQDRSDNRALALTPIYTGRFPRPWLAPFDWTKIDQVQALHSAPGARLALKGSTREVTPISVDPHTSTLIDTLREQLAGLPLQQWLQNRRQVLPRRRDRSTSGMPSCSRLRRGPVK